MSTNVYENPVPKTPHLLTSEAKRELLASNKLAANSWHHVVLVVASREQRVYLDGSLVGRAATPASLRVNSQWLRFGDVREAGDHATTKREHAPLREPAVGVREWASQVSGVRLAKAGAARGGSVRHVATSRELRHCTPRVPSKQQYSRKSALNELQRLARKSLKQGGISKAAYTPSVEDVASAPMLLGKGRILRCVGPNARLRHSRSLQGKQ